MKNKATINTKKWEITDILFFDHTTKVQISETEYEEIKSYSANIIINDCMVVQLSGSDNEEHPVYIPNEDESYWEDKKSQKYLYEKGDEEKITKFLNKEGIENSFNFLQENDTGYF